MITPEQINAFRAKVLPKRQGFFDDEVSSGDKQILTLLYNLSDEEISSLVERGESRSVGFHEIGGHLYNLTYLTGEERFQRIAQEAIDKKRENKV